MGKKFRKGKICFLIIFLIGISVVPILSGSAIKENYKFPNISGNSPDILWEVEGHTQSVYGVAFSHDGETVASGANTDVGFCFLPGTSLARCSADDCQNDDACNDETSNGHQTSDFGRPVFQSAEFVPSDESLGNLGQRRGSLLDRQSQLVRSGRDSLKPKSRDWPAVLHARPVAVVCRQSMFTDNPAFLSHEGNLCLQSVDAGLPLFARGKRRIRLDAQRLAMGAAKCVNKLAHVLAGLGEVHLHADRLCKPCRVGAVSHLPACRQEANAQREDSQGYCAANDPAPGTLTLHDYGPATAAFRGLRFKRRLIHCPER